MIASGSLDEKRQVAYQSFLFLVMYVCLFRLSFFLKADSPQTPRNPHRPGTPVAAATGFYPSCDATVAE